MYMTVFKMTRDSILNSEHPLDINDTNGMHQLLTNCQNISREKGKILYKVLYTKDEIYFYVQTKDRFNRNGLEEKGLVFIKEMNIDYGTISGTYDFDVQVFPNRTVNGKRYFIKDRNDRYNWLSDIFEKNGITLLEGTEYKLSPVHLNKNNSVLVDTAAYRGKIYIKDMGKAKALFENGMGRMKNYGLGLILIK